MKQLRTTGLAAHSIILGMLVIAVLSLVSWRVLAGSSGQAGQTDSQAANITAASHVTVPAGWTLYQNADVGVQFAYPEAYGGLRKVTDYGNGLSARDFPDFESTWHSDVVSTPILPGLGERLTLTTYKKGKTEVTSRKYGPKIKLQGDKWVVTEPYKDYNPQSYRAGDEYKEMSRINTAGMPIYATRSGDEGIIVYVLYFYSHDRLHELRLPEFNTGEYGDSAVFNDQKLYEDFYKQFIASVAPF